MQISIVKAPIPYSDLPLFLISLILTNLLLESASAAHFLPEFDSAAKKIKRKLEIHRNQFNG